MKKVLFTLLLFSGLMAQAQTELLISAGYGGANVDVEAFGIHGTSDSTNAVSLGVGGLTTLSDHFKIDYGIAAGIATENFGENWALGAGFGGRYYPTNGVFLRGGAGLGISLSGSDPGYNDISITLGPGIGFDLSDSVTILGGFSWQVNNAVDFDGVSAKAKGWNAGIQIKL